VSLVFVDKDLEYCKLLFLLNAVVDDSLLNTTLQVIIMEGQLDVICNTGGA